MDKKKKQVGKTILWGALSVGLYAALFSRGNAVAHLFAQGSWYAILPVATVFLFSVVHGTFASYLGSLLGIEAKKQAQPRPKAEKRAVRRKRPRPQAQLQA
jgi:bacteriorhodopsin